MHDFDAGAVVAQRKVFLDDGVDYLTINRLLAEAGAVLLLEQIETILSKRLDVGVQPSRTLETVEQDYYPYPQQRDFVIDATASSARQLFNFMCATQVFAMPYHYEGSGFGFLLDKAVDYDNNLQLGTTEVIGDVLHIPCKEGVLIASYTAKL